VAAGWSPETIYLNLHGEPLLDPLFSERLRVLSELSLRRGRFADQRSPWARQAEALIAAGCGA
jgi:hypothetical protein